MLFARRVIALPYLWLYFMLFYGAYLFLYPGAIQNYWNRYQHSFIPFIIMAVAAGAVAASSMAQKRASKIIIVAFIAASILYNQGASFIAAYKTYNGEISSTRNPKIDLALWLKHNTPGNSLIALHDIGAVGYFSGRKMLDLVGLVNPGITKYYLDKQSKRVIPLSERKVIDYLKQKRPDYLVMFPEWDRFFNLLQPANSKYFTLIHTTLPLYPTEMDNLYRLAWVRGLKTTYYLRSLGATHVEKPTMDEANRANRLNAVKVAALDAGTAAPKACSILDPDCEACQ